MLIGERIKKARLNKGLTQEELGALLDVTKVSVCGYEKGNRTPTMEVLLKLVEVLNVSIDYLIGNDVKVLNEDSVPYEVKIAKEDLEIIKELKNNRELYNKLCSDPKRTIQLIIRKLK